ncbi:serine protease [Streptomyces sp. NPDC057638]|uniref:serine protease n=1 Tax=Streptomyces sp. NPDC057638 TaxID=3346190 RepID=UPI0036771628
MNTSSIPRRGVLRTLAVAVALVGGTVPAWNSAAHAVTPPETFTLTIKHLGRDGLAAEHYKTIVSGLSGAGADEVVRASKDPSGVVSVTLPRGRYVLESEMHTGIPGGVLDWLVQPRLDLDGDTTVTVDARTTAPVDVRPPDAAAGQVLAFVGVLVSHGGKQHLANYTTAGSPLRIGHMGPDAEPGSLRQWYDVYWKSGTDRGYGLSHSVTGSRALTGLVKHPEAKDLATIKVRGVERSEPGGAVFLGVEPSQGESAGVPYRLPASADFSYLVTPERGSWNLGYSAHDADGNTIDRYEAPQVPVSAGATTTRTFGNAVIGPDLTGRPGVVREGDRLSVDVPLLADSDGHVPARTDFTGATTTLRRDGVVIGQESGTPGRAVFTLPAGPGTYRLTSTVRRGAAGTGGRVSAEWTFAARAVSGPVAVPVSVVRFTPELTLRGTAAAGTALRVPVTVQGAAAQGRIRSLTVSFSVDGGASWRRLPVVRGAVTVPNPRPGTGVSLRAELTDIGGNTLVQTQTDAYRTH